MTLRQAFSVLRRWRSLVVAGTLIGVVVGFLSAQVRPPRTAFKATQSLLADAETRRTSRVEQAAVMATKGAVPDRVAARLGIDPQSVRSAVSAETPPNTGLLLITGRSGDPRQAEALANLTAEELLAELGGPTSGLSTLEPAAASPVETNDIEGPSSRPGRALLLGVFGLFLGVGSAFAVDRFDDRIGSKRTAEEALGVAVIAELPPIPRSDHVRLLTGAESSPVIEAFRRLRTFVIAWTPKTASRDGHRVIVVTSPHPGEGKTATVAHLAATIAEFGQSVLVISADLRRPRLHLYFDRPPEPGLTDMLRGAPDVRKLTDLNLATGIQGIRFVASGAPVHNTAPLIEHAGDVLEAARTMADFVLVDSPALLGTSDAAELAVHADEVLLVVRAGRTSVKAARRSAELLGRLDIPVLGAVLVASDTAPTSSR
jgi:capsular exopolysaccharide synthesis family protein